MQVGSNHRIARASEQIDTDSIVPVHTATRDWFRESFENAVLVDEGKRYRR